MGVLLHVSYGISWYLMISWNLDLFLVGLNIWAARHHFVGILDLLSEGYEITRMQYCIRVGVPSDPSEGFCEALAIHGNLCQ